MSKYIVDIDDFEPHFKVDSIGVFGIGKSLSYSEEDHSWSRIKSIEEFEELNSDYINENFGELQDEAYKRGYAEAERIWRAPSSDNEFYQKGLGDAWEAAQKIMNMPDPPYWDVFCEYKNELFKKLSASEAIAKLKAYEDKRSDRIEVGDIVDVYGNLGVVTYTHENGFNVMMYDGSAGYWKQEDLKKTGKHYDIQSILETMQNVKGEDNA